MTDIAVDQMPETIAPPSVFGQQVMDIYRAATPDEQRYIEALIAALAGAGSVELALSLAPRGLRTKVQRLLTH